MDLENVLLVVAEERLDEDQITYFNQIFGGTAHIRYLQDLGPEGADLYKRIKSIDEYTDAGDVTLLVEEFDRFFIDDNLEKSVSHCYVKLNFRFDIVANSSAPCHGVEPVCVYPSSKVHRVLLPSGVIQETTEFSHPMWHRIYGF